MGGFVLPDTLEVVQHTPLPNTLISCLPFTAKLGLILWLNLSKNLLSVFIKSSYLEYIWYFTVSEYFNMLMLKMFLLRPHCVVFLLGLSCIRYCKIFLRTVYNIWISYFRAVVSKEGCCQLCFCLPSSRQICSNWIFFLGFTSSYLHIPRRNQALPCKSPVLKLSVN